MEYEFRGGRDPKRANVTESSAPCQTCITLSANGPLR